MSLIDSLSSRKEIIPEKSDQITQQGFFRGPK